MKVYRKIAIVLSIVLGFSFSVFCLVFGPAPQMAINNPITEEDYELLKENSLTVAKTLDNNSLTDETFTADFYINQDELVVTVESFKAKVTAKIPISDYSWNMENGVIKSQMTPEFKNVEFEETPKIESALFYFVIMIPAGAFLSVMLYFLLYKMWEIRPKKN